MSWNYENYLKRQLTILARDYNVNVEIATEQMFAKIKDPVPNTIYVVIKYLSTSIAFNSTVRPIQILVVSEGNQMANAKAIFDTFANDFNWQMVIDGQTYVKQQYSNPVVLSNFNDIGYDFRSVLYMSGTLIQMDNVVDISTTLENVVYEGAISVKIGENEPEIIKPITFQFQYNTGCDTQPIGGSMISSSIKSVSTFSLMFTIPAQTSTLLRNCVSISANNQSGNTKFNIIFTLSGISFNYDCILTSFNFTTSPNNVPALQFGFMR